jgi:hypothetical protein
MFASKTPYIVSFHFSKFQRASHQQISVPGLGRNKSRKMCDIIASTKYVFFKFRFGGGGELQAGRLPPPLGCATEENNSYMTNKISRRCCRLSKRVTNKTSQESY